MDTSFNKSSTQLAAKRGWWTSAGRALHEEVLPGEVSLTCSSAHISLTQKSGTMIDPTRRKNRKISTGRETWLPRDLLSKLDDRKTPLSAPIGVDITTHKYRLTNDDPLTSSLTSY